MSGIYIHDMKLPEEGWHKVIKIFSDGTVVSYYDSVELGKAVPVPDHGDLIERNAVVAAYDAEHVGPPGRARELMMEAPAVIQADKEAET